MAQSIGKVDISLDKVKKAVNVIVCDDWPYTRAGIFIRVPYAGSAAQKEMLNASAHLAINRNGSRLFRQHLHGRHFNIIAMRMGVRHLKIHQTFDADGCVSAIELRAEAKPHQVGQAMALMASLFYHAPVGGDRSYPYFKPFSTD